MPLHLVLVMVVNLYQNPMVVDLYLDPYVDFMGKVAFFFFLKMKAISYFRITSSQCRLSTQLNLAFHYTNLKNT